LERHYGPAVPPVSGAFAFVVLEQIGYLTDDRKRAAAFSALAERVGIDPAAIAGAPHATLSEIASLGGIYGAERAERLKRSAALVLERCDGDLDSALQTLPLTQARRLARSFDSFGAANAETWLLFAGGESGRYAADHRRACDFVASGDARDHGFLMRAYLAFRRHGKTVCRRSAPACPTCPLASDCSFIQR
jgi:endonuclease III